MWVESSLCLKSIHVIYLSEELVHPCRTIKGQPSYMMLIMSSFQIFFLSVQSRCLSWSECKGQVRFINLRYISYTHTFLSSSISYILVGRKGQLHTFFQGAAWKLLEHIGIWVQPSQECGMRLNEISLLCGQSPAFPLSFPEHNDTLILFPTEAGSIFKTAEDFCPSVTWYKNSIRSFFP